MVGTSDDQKPRYFYNASAPYVKERSSHQGLYYRKQLHRMQRYYDLLADTHGLPHEPPLLIDEHTQTPVESNLRNEGVHVNRTVSTYTGRPAVLRRPRNLAPVLPFHYRVAHGMCVRACECWCVRVSYVFCCACACVLCGFFFCN